MSMSDSASMMPLLPPSPAGGAGVTRGVNLWIVFSITPVFFVT
uniref:Uncharacterized protein n=1 Tax=Anopheles christyi TaxID=43041 RepID=A0A182KIQ6_9DIPT